MKHCRTVGFAVKAISNEFMRFIDNRLRSGEITGMQHGILIFIINSADDIFQRDVEKEFNIRRPTATGMLQLMEKNGFIQREPVKCDARLKKLVVTQKGKEIIESDSQHILEIESIITKGITDKELTIFFQVLDKIMKNISQADLSR